MDEMDKPQELNALSKAIEIGDRVNKRAIEVKMSCLKIYESLTESNTTEGKVVSCDKKGPTNKIESIGCQFENIEDELSEIDRILNKIKQIIGG